MEKKALHFAYFVELTEPRTKAASLIPFAFGAAWAVWRYGTFDPAGLALFLGSLLPIDLATTALNNALDRRRAARAEGLPVAGFRAALVATAFLFGAGIACGIALAVQTDAVVFLAGAAAVAVAIAYSAGPLPISRTPFGEVFSGLTMGAGIPFVAIYVQVCGTANAPVALRLGYPLTGLSLNLAELVSLALASLPFVLWIANVMLANNLRDLSSDRESGRLTLPMVIGRPAALKLFAAIHVAGCIAIIPAAVFGALPTMSLVALIALPLRARALARFIRSGPESVPFGVSVGNLFVSGGILAGTVIVAAFRGIS